MSGSLIKIDEVIASSSASVTLGGANWDNSYDVYKVVVSNATTDTDNKALQFRYLDTSNNPITTANYDVAQKVLRTDTTFEDSYATGMTNGLIIDNYIGTATGEVANATMYIFNSNNSSEYTFNTIEASYRNASGILRGNQGGTVLDSAVATKGISLFMSSGNIDSGTFTLYGLKK
jgi:hypothetical protein